MRRALFPVIGVAVRAMQIERRSRPFWGVFDAYIDAVRRVGGEVVLLPIGAGTEALNLCHGLLLVGGEDLSQHTFWQQGAPQPPLDPQRDSAETAMILQCQRIGLPTLALCRGAQLVNCVLGGQVSRSPPTSSCDHGGVREAVHWIRVERDSRLAGILKPRLELEVTSRHSAYLARLGDGLRASAWGPDGSIEAVEGEAWLFIGVQWHAEWAGPGQSPDLALFKWLVAAASGRKDA